MPEGAEKNKIPEIPIDIPENPKPNGKIISFLDKYQKRKSYFQEKEDFKPFFIIPLRQDKYKENLIETPERKRTYTPRVEVASRSDAGFYQTFYATETLGIFADYDDIVAQFLARNPNAKLKFHPDSGRVEAEGGTVSPAELNGFIQSVLPYVVSASAFDPEGSTRRVEERQWFQAINGINMFSRSTALLDLQRLGLLQRVVSGVTQRELIEDRLVDTHKQVLRKFYRRRQNFWHPDRWNYSNGLIDTQKKQITEMSAKLNRLEKFVR